MILIINLCKEQLHYYEFVKPIEDILQKNKIEFLTKHYSKITEGDLHKADKIIICGTSLKDNTFLEEIDNFTWLKKINKPVFGICAGMQIIGLIFDGKLKKQKEIGLEKIKFTKDFLGFIGEKQVYTLHNNYIEFSKDFEVFAKTKNCAQAIKHKHKEIYGTLFHPEVRNYELIKQFVVN